MNKQQIQKAIKAIQRVCDTNDGKAMMEYLRHCVGFDEPMFNKKGDNINQALIKDGGRQLVILIEKTAKAGEKLNPNIDNE